MAKQTKLAPQVKTVGRKRTGGPKWPSLRPQSLMLTFLGNYVLGQNICAFSGSIIEIFSRVGVAEEAARSTLGRMARRGLLVRRRKGRRTYFGLTERSIAILREGEARVWQTGAVNLDANGAWTLLAFSLPQSWQQRRHELRSRLLWAGFGPLQNGLWIAPSDVDAAALVGDLGLEAHIKVFSATPRRPTDVAQLIGGTYDLAGLSARYRDFLVRWAGPTPLPDAPDALARTLVLSTEWLQIIRQDPRLPVNLLPGDWPAIEAQRTFKELHARYDKPARHIAASILDVIRADPGSRRGR